MNVSDAGYALIKRFENCKLVAYPDPGDLFGPWTIGWGHTGPEVHKGHTITQQQADAHLIKDVQQFVDAINKLVMVPLKQNQFDALVSFVYNVGITAFSQSTLLKRLLKKDVAGAGLQFLLWNKNNGKIMNGLVRRRQAEKDLFLS